MSTRSSGNALGKGLKAILQATATELEVPPRSIKKEIQVGDFRLYRDEDNLYITIHTGHEPVNIRQILQTLYEHSKKGDFDEISDHEKLLDVTHKLNTIGQHYFNRQLYADASQEFKKALDLMEDARLYFNLALTYENLGKSELALKYYRKSLDLDPGEVDTYRNMGLLFYKKGQYDQAMLLLQRALKLKPNLGLDLTKLELANHQNHCKNIKKI